MKTSVLLMITLLLCSQAFGIDLDAPAAKKITVKSELERGQSAVDDCPGQGETDCVDKIIAINRQQNTDTDAFLLGANFEAWLTSAIHIEGYIKRGLNIPQSELIAAARFYKAFRNEQQAVGIDDATLCEVLRVRYDIVKPRMDVWAEKFKSQ